MLKLFLRFLFIFIILNLTLNAHAITPNRFASTEIFFENTGLSDYDKLFFAVNHDTYNDDIVIIPKTYDDKIIYFANDYTFEYFGMKIPDSNQYYSNGEYYDTQENIGEIPYLDKSNKIVFKTIDQVNNINSSGVNHVYTNMNYPEFDDFLKMLESDAKFKNITFQYNYYNYILENIYFIILAILITIFFTLDFYTSLNKKKKIYSLYTLNGFSRFVIFRKMFIKKSNFVINSVPIFILCLTNISLFFSKSNIFVMVFAIIIYLVIIFIMDIIYYINVIIIFKDLNFCLKIIRGERVNINDNKIISIWNFFLRLVSILTIICISVIMPNYLTTLSEFNYWIEIKEYYYPYTSQYYLREEMRGNSPDVFNEYARLEQEEFILFLENKYDFRYAIENLIEGENILFSNYNYLKGINFPNLAEIDRNYDYLLVSEKKNTVTDEYIESIAESINSSSASLESTLNKAVTNVYDSKYIDERELESSNIKILTYDSDVDLYSYNIEINNANKNFNVDYIFLPKNDELPAFIAEYAIQEGFLYIENVIDDPDIYTREYFLSSGDSQGIDNLATRIPNSKYDEYGIYVENIYLFIIAFLTLSIIAILTYIYNVIFTISFYFENNRNILLLKRIHGVSFNNTYKSVIMKNILLNVIMYLLVTCVALLFFKPAIMVMPFAVTIVLMLLLDIFLTLIYIKKIESKNFSTILKGLK